LINPDSEPEMEGFGRACSAFFAPKTRSGRALDASLKEKGNSDPAIRRLSGVADGPDFQGGLPDWIRPKPGSQLRRLEMLPQHPEEIGFAPGNCRAPSAANPQDSPPPRRSGVRRRRSDRPAGYAQRRSREPEKSDSFSHLNV